jgi:hypothetical protein
MNSGSLKQLTLLLLDRKSQVNQAGLSPMFKEFFRRNASRLLLNAAIFGYYFSVVAEWRHLVRLLSVLLVPVKSEQLKSLAQSCWGLRELPYRGRPFGKTNCFVQAQSSHLLAWCRFSPQLARWQWTSCEWLED